MIKKIGEGVLWLRAMTYLKQHKPLLIGVTGSYGKTMTKEAIALALHGKKRIRVSRESYNTPVGVALSILGMKAAQDRVGWVRLLAGSRVRETIVDPEPDTIVLELGADRPGDIDFLAQKLPFQVGVVTGVGSAHLQYFIEKENIAHEKMSLIVSLPKEGYAVLNIDDPLVRSMADHTRAKIVWFGTGEGAHIRLIRAERLGIQGFAIEVEVDGKRFECSVPNIVGRHQLSSILAALVVARVLEVDIPQALDRVKNLVPPAGRLRMLDGKGGSVILDDTYNAPPEAVVSALTTLDALKSKASQGSEPKGRTIAILGDMLELGAHSIPWHADIGRMVAKVADVFVAVGPNMKHAQAAALQGESLRANLATTGGPRPDGRAALPSAHRVDTHHFEDSRDVGKWLADFLREGDIVLVKGSRDMHMEEVVRRLVVHPE